MTVELKGSTVLVTGATGGIGQAIARALHARGAHVIVSGRSGDVLEGLRAELGRASRRWSRTCPTRLRSRRWLGGRRLDVLVANAALPGVRDASTASPPRRSTARSTSTCARRCSSPARSCRRCSSGARATSCLISSLAGKMASAGGSVYSATKFGLRGFGFALNVELRGTGVGVTTVFPGFIRDAGMFADSGAKLPRGVGTRTPEEVAEAVSRDRAQPRRGRRGAAVAVARARGCSASRRSRGAASTGGSDRTRWPRRSPTGQRDKR